MEQYVNNPLNVILMIKRASSDTNLIRNRFPEKSTIFLNTIKNLQPSENDLNEAVEGLLRLQSIYKLKSDDFANGIVDGKRSRARLSAHDLFIIAEEAFKLKGQEYFAKEYYKLSLIKIPSDVDKEVDENSLLMKWATSYSKSKEFPQAIVLVDMLIQKNPESKEFVALKESLVSGQAKQGNKKVVLKDPFSDAFERNGKFTKLKEKILYSQVCRGNVTKSPKDLAKLHCRYISSNQFSRLARFKVEEINLNPNILLFIDVVTNDEMELVKNMSKSKATRATILTTAGSKISSKRVSQIAWLHEIEHEVLKKLSQRVEVYQNVLNLFNI